MEDESGWNPNLGGGQPSSSPSPSTPIPSSPRRLNLLLAEDNLADALLVREHLPFDIYSAVDGHEAIEFIAAAEADPHAPSPHLLLLDLNLPKKDGFDVLKRLRTSEKYGAIPVIIFTSSDAAVDRRVAAELGARYFRKPATYEEFLNLGSVLKRVLTENGLL